MHRLTWFGAAIVCLLLLLFPLHIIVMAAFGSSTSVVQGGVSSAVLQPPTAPTATGGCQVLVLGPKVTLNWTISTSTFATSYDVYRATVSSGPYALLANVPGGTTNTYTDTATLGLNTTYYYRLQAVYLNWRSASSTQASGTTPLLCL